MLDKLFVKNTFWTLLGHSMRLAIKVAYFILLARMLGPSEYGKFSSIAALTTIFVPFSSWGSGSVLVKQVSRDRGSFPLHWRNSLLITLISGFVLAISVVSLASFVLPSSISIVSVGLLAFADLIFGRLTDISVQASLAFEKYKLMTGIQFCASLLLFLSVCFLYLFAVSPDFLWWSYLYFFSAGLSGLASLLLVRVKLLRGTIRVRDSIDKFDFREGFYFSINTASQATYNDIDKVLLGNISGLSIAGVYSAAYRIINMLFIPVSALMTSGLPRFFRNGKGGIGAALRWGSSLMKVSATYSIASIILIIVVKPLVPLMLGDGFAVVTEILLWLAPLLMFKSIHYSLGDTLTGSGLQKNRSIIQVLVAFLNVWLNLILIPYYSWRGAVVSSLVSDGCLVIAFWIMIQSKLKSSGSNEITP